MPDKKKLAAGLKSVRSKQGYFAVIPVGGAGGALLVGKKPIPKDDIDAELAQLNGGTVYKGVCGPGAGGLLFECDKSPPGNLATTIQALARSQGGVTITAVTQKRVKKAVDAPDSPVANIKTAKKPPEEIDKNLLKGLMRAKTGNVNFAAVVKDSKAGRLFISKRKVAPTEISLAKTQCEATKVFRGTCHAEGSTFIFELLTKPPGSLAKVIKAYAKKQAGKLIKVKCVQVQQIADIDEKEGDEVTAPPIVLADLKGESLAWSRFRTKALLDLANLERAIRALANDQGNAHPQETLQAAGILLALRNNFPDPLGGPLAGLDHAAATGDAINHATSHKLTLQGVNAINAYLNQHREVVKQLPKNPLGVKIDLLTDVRIVLKSIVDALA